MRSYDQLSIGVRLAEDVGAKSLSTAVVANHSNQAVYAEMARLIGCGESF